MKLQSDKGKRANIERSNLSFQLAKDDMLDHFCCVVEDRMMPEPSFVDAYYLAWKKNSPNGLNEIQEKTIYLLNALRRVVMKKVMYSIGLVACICISVGWLFTLLHWPGGGKLFTYGFLGFAMIFLPMFALDRYKASVGKPMSERWKIILGFSSALLTGLSVFFKLMYWPGATMLLIVGVGLFSIGFLPFLFFGMYKKAVDKGKAIS
ncbi:hypothetical protein [Tunicatimonas pelagia]|uniref:hypothetical protein n=1 Tax=Tunicatimonas pelagia TaxID=931531 RepID=UPI002666AC64|nr:hypothetical protein [Tunicatimonas pelagia]WKN42140.1 hypothetical protein P0M28_24190 [Tunicatimonas pelagia]